MGRKVMIAGGGASGLMAAIASAREGAEVTVLEGMAVSYTHLTLPTTSRV